MNKEREKKEIGSFTAEKYVYKAEKGINEKIIRKISELKKEPEWMLDLRLKGYKEFLRLSMPDFGPSLNINFDDIIYYVKPLESQVNDWNELPKEIKETFDKLGIPEIEQKFLAGIETQYESEIILKKVKTSLKEKGVIFMSMDEALQSYPDLVRKYFGKLVSVNDNKFAALNTAVWSGGTFIYVPKGIRLDMPLQTYFRINMIGIGQFERTLIIADEGSYVHYIEGCTAPIYDKSNLHAAVVEVFVHKNAKVRFTTIQNWSKNVINLATKRCIVDENGKIEWIDGNLGSGITMKYPAIILRGDNSKGEILNLVIAGKNQEIDSGGKIICIGKNTKGKIISKSIVFNGGKNTYRGMVKILKNSLNSRVYVSCDGLISDKNSISNSYPLNISYERTAVINHEAKIGSIDKDKIFYLMCRGINEDDAKALITLGFIDDIIKELPLEYAIELNKIIKMEFEK